MMQRDSLAVTAIVTEHNRYHAHRRQWYIPQATRPQPTKDEFRKILMERLAIARGK